MGDLRTGNISLDGGVRRGTVAAEGAVDAGPRQVVGVVRGGSSVAMSVHGGKAPGQGPGAMVQPKSCGHTLSTKLRKRLLRLGWRSFRSAFASI
jgi:hypothetical protein